MSLFKEKDSRAYVRQVQIRNYKSIGWCSVELSDLTILVGRNGAGKSNFLDALRFVTDGLKDSLEQAVRSRGGIEAVRRKSTGHPRNFAIRLELLLPELQTARYDFEIAARVQGGFAVKKETLHVSSPSGDTTAHYSVREGRPTNGSPDRLPVASPDRLYLVAASSLPHFRPVYDALVSMGFYNLNPDAMKELQGSDAGELLHRDGSNIASVVDRLSNDKPEVFRRIKEYLERIVPGVKEFKRVPLGPRETLEFRQEIRGSKNPWTFHAASMSDGTLRALGALTAVTQLANRRMPVTLVGIEEPETALHPAASGTLVDALREAASQTQIVVTTHSPDLLDLVDPEKKESLLVVESRGGTTLVASPDTASREAIKNHLYTAGELLRMEQLQPDEAHIQQQEAAQLSFGFTEAEETER